jgi:hypothetical protein
MLPPPFPPPPRAHPPTSSRATYDGRARQFVRASAGTPSAVVCPLVDTSVDRACPIAWTSASRASVALRVCATQVVMWPRRALLVLYMRWWPRGWRCRWAAAVRVETPTRLTKPQLPRRNSPLRTTHVAACSALHHGTQPCRWATVAYAETPTRLATPQVPRRNSSLCATHVVPWLALQHGTQPRAHALPSLVVHYISIGLLHRAQLHAGRPPPRTTQCTLRPDMRAQLRVAWSVCMMLPAGACSTNDGREQLGLHRRSLFMPHRGRRRMCALLGMSSS